MEYKTRLDPLVRRQLIRWNLPDSLLVFYQPDEQTLLVTRGAHVTAEGM